jgi:hypothetical protein
MVDSQREKEFKFKVMHDEKINITYRDVRDRDQKKIFIGSRTGTERKITETTTGTNA